VVLWREIRAVKDPQVRRGLLARIAEALASTYANRVHGETVNERMDSLSALFAERRIPLESKTDGGLPVLSVRQCPYPDLAEVDQGICAMEKLMFSQLLEQEVRLSECRLQGHACCTFEVGPRGKQEPAGAAV
jgi:predicted ArsR family transcriptional regulator